MPDSVDILADPRAVARAVLVAIDGEHVSLRPRHSDYEIRLALAGPGTALEGAPGRAVAGVIEARALRIHPASGGGRFIEPVIGEPRIVAGRIVAAEAAQRRVLVDVAVPMWLRTDNGQDFGILIEGGLVNCYLRSGATFTPLPE